MSTLYDILNDTSFGFTGAGAQINIWNTELNKYSLFVPTESVPSIVGSVETVEHRPTTARNVGQIKGLTTLDNKDVNYLYCRQNNEVLDKYLGSVQKFLTSYPDGSGWKFSAEYTYKPDDLESSGKGVGIITFIPTEADTSYTPDISDIFANTCIATNMTTSKVKLNKNHLSETITLALSNASGTVEVESTNSSISASVSGKVVTISVTSATKTSGIVKITTKATNEASWTYPVFVQVEA